MKVTTFGRLALHYVSVFRAFGLVLLADRVARRLLPVSIYRLTWRKDKRGGSDTYLYETSICEDIIPADLDPESFHSRAPDMVREITATAADIVDHRFDFLGTGPSDWGNPIEWNKDVKSGYSWPLAFFRSSGNSYSAGEDIKIPWELSRFHHGVVLAQAYFLSGEVAYANELLEQWNSWKKANPFLCGVNWISPMEASIRSINLIYAVSLVAAKDPAVGAKFSTLAFDMREHGIFIERNLEIGSDKQGLVTGNHYLANLAGLACIGMAFTTLPEAARWKSVGLRGLQNEANRQVLPDGLWWEGSTSYHRLAFEFFVIPALMADRSNVQMGQPFWNILERMTEVIFHLTGPQGQVAVIGDCDDGRLLIPSGYPGWDRKDHRYALAIGAALFSRTDMKAVAGDSYTHLFWILGKKGVDKFDSISAKGPVPGIKALKDGGICVIRGDRQGDFAVMRTGSIVPYAPTGHLHNDALSVEIWIGGEAVTLDPGTISYTSNAEARDEFRSTLSHATVSLNGAEQHMFIPESPFELELQTRVELLEHRFDESKFLVKARASWQNEGVHTRTLSCDRFTGDWCIADEVAGASTAVWSWPLAPDRTTLEAQVEADFPLVESVTEGRMAVSYGVEVPIRTVRYTGTLNGEGKVEFRFNGGTGMIRQ